MTEITMAIVAPALGGVLSFFLWYNKRNSETVQRSFDLLHKSNEQIERKVDEIRLDVAKNYVTNEDLLNHIKNEEEWHKVVHDEIKDIKNDVRGTRNIINRILMDGDFFK